MNKENSEKVAVIFFIPVPYFFNIILKHIIKFVTLRATLSGERNCGVAESRLSGQSNTAVMEGKARSLGRRKLGKIFHLKIYSKFCHKVTKSSTCFEEIPVLRLILN